MSAIDAETSPAAGPPVSPATPPPIVCRRAAPVDGVVKCLGDGPRVEGGAREWLFCAPGAAISLWVSEAAVSADRATHDGRVMCGACGAAYKVFAHARESAAAGEPASPAALSPQPQPAAPAPAPAPGLTVRVTAARLVASWRWTVAEPDEVCGICRLAFESPCPTCRFAGDDCPPLVGQCTHAFHLHCIHSWLGAAAGKAGAAAPEQVCPLCRRPWA